MSRDRDRYVPKHPTPVRGLVTEDWREEPTGVGTDAQVFRAIKALGAELGDNKREAAKAHGALKQEVTQLKSEMDTRLTKQDLALERIGGQMDVLVPMKRTRPDSRETRAIATEVIEKHSVTTTTRFRRELVLKIVGGVIALVTSTAFITWWLS